MKLSEKAKISITAALSGLCNAVLGAGGGILLTLALSKVQIGGFSDRRDLLATSQAAMIPCCIASCFIYGARGMLDTANFAVFAIPAALGGIVGSILMNKLSPQWIGKLFAVFVIWSGARMVIGQ